MSKERKLPGLTALVLTAALAMGSGCAPRVSEYEVARQAISKTSLPDRSKEIVARRYTLLKNLSSEERKKLVNYFNEARVNDPNNTRNCRWMNDTPSELDKAYMGYVHQMWKMNTSPGN